MFSSLPILAQQFPVTEQTASVLNVIAVSLAIAFLVKNLFKKDPQAAPLPQPVVTKRQDEFVLRHEFDRLSKEHANLATRVEKVHNDLIKAGEERAVKIHERLNIVIEGVAEIRGRSEALASALTERDPVTRKVRARAV